MVLDPAQNLTYHIKIFKKGSDKVKYFLLLLAVLLGLVFGAGVFVRLASVDPARWHNRPEMAAPGDTGTANSFLAVRVPNLPPAEALAAAERVILGTPRTTRIAGSLAEGMVTYETRSRLWRFPDYTTVAVRDDETPVIALYGRARFGSSDLGVNKARILGWLDRLGLGS